MKRIKCKNKISNTILLLGSLIFFFTFLIFNYYSKRLNNKIIEVSEVELKKWTKLFLSKNIGYDLLANNKIDNILEINTNKNDEILYVNYNLKDSYEILEDITTEINNKIYELENGSNINDRYIHSKNGLYLYIPFFIASSNVLLVNYGPKIVLPINFIGSILTNLKTKIVDYGLNNALIEMYVTIEVTLELITPVTKKEILIGYDVLVASKVINGRVPEIYGGCFYTKSSAFSIPIE